MQYFISRENTCQVGQKYAFRDRKQRQFSLRFICIQPPHLPWEDVW